METSNCWLLYICNHFISYYMVFRITIEIRTTKSIVKYLRVTIYAYLCSNNFSKCNEKDLYRA